MLVIGIDPSSKKLAACFAGGSPERPKLHDFRVAILGKGKYRPSNAGEAYIVVADWLATLEAQWGKPHTFLESPVVGTGGVHSTLVQSFVSGAVQAACAQADCEIELVNVSSWKKAVVGHGHATKQDVGANLEEQWPKAAKGAGGDQDSVDAATIALYGLGELGRR